MRNRREHNIHRVLVSQLPLNPPGTLCLLLHLHLTIILLSIRSLRFILIGNLSRPHQLLLLVDIKADQVELRYKARHGAPATQDRIFMLQRPAEED